MSSFQQIINSDKLVLVDFFATWCGPCKMMSPILQDVRAQLGDNIRIIKIDVDKNPALAAQQQVQGVPTLVLFKSGKQIWRQSGVVPAHQLVALLNEKIG